MKKILLFMLVTLVITACLPQNVQVPQSPLLSTLERKSGLIAYIGADGNIFVSDQGGGNILQLTKDAMATANQSGASVNYQLPTWSLDGNQLAFVGTSGTSLKATTALFVANIKAKKVNEIYSSATERPFYLYWSPDNANVGFLSTSVTGQAMILQSAPVNGGKSTVIDTGSPYYWSWAPNGHALITHSGGATNSTAPEHLAFIQLQDSGIIEDGLDTTPASFQAPAWSPDGSHIVLTSLKDKKKEIILTDGTGKYQKSLGSFDINTAFGWSPDSKKVAFINSTQALNAGVIGELNVTDIASSATIKTGKNIIAFFWSPDAKRLAYYALFFSDQNPDGTKSTTQHIVLQLNMLDVKTGTSRKLFSYQPTDQFINILPYFDQYQQSNTIWSPDNNNLVLSFIDSAGTPSIAIVAASGNLEPRVLAKGYLAFWSWK